MSNSHSDTSHNSSQPHVLTPHSTTAAVAGSAFEFYDFTSYTFFSVYIANAFFPAQDFLISILLTVTVFGIGYITRPLGALWIGQLADRRGRKYGMLLSTLCMGIGTAGMALTPSYSSIGMAAPIIIVICRLLQGIALGGESGSICAYLIETAPARWRGFFSSWQLGSQGIAAILAGVIGAVCLAVFTKEQMYDWGWRVPFIIGLLFSPVVWLIRRQMPESLSDQQVRRHQAIKGFMKQFEGQWYVLFVGAAMVMGGSAALAVGLYMTTYATTILKVPHFDGMTTAIVFGLSMLFGSVLGGYLSDHFGRVRVMMVARLAVLILAVPGFYWLSANPTTVSLGVVTFVLGFFSSMFSAVGTVLGSEVYPRHIRAISLAVTGALCLSLFGSTAQVLITWLIHLTGSPLIPACYLIVTGLISLWSVFQVTETRFNRLHE